MAVYNNTNKASPLMAVEFTPVSDGNFSFFHIDTPENKEQVKQWLISNEVGQEIVAETLVGGKPVLVTHGDKTKDEMMALLEAKGERLELHKHKKTFSDIAWPLRGGMSIVGQTLQLASALMGAEQIKNEYEMINGIKTLKELHPKLDPAKAHYNPKLKESMWVRKPFAADIGVFAILNLMANAANIIWGGQKESGKNRLRHVKGLINDDLDEHLAIGDTPIGIDDNRAELRKGPQGSKNLWQKFNAFAERNSVRFFEIGLRYIAAIALVIPMRKPSLRKGWTELRKGHVIDAYKAARNNENPLTKWSGFGYLAGKTLALFTKVRDPYEDKPHTWLDTVREDYLFKVGGAIESAAGAAIAYNAFAKKKIGLFDRNKPDITPHADFLGGTGGVLFALGYIVRMGAKFGTKNVNMEEVYAHATDTLAKTPPDKLPQLMADTAATLKEHFKDKPIEFGEIFTKMMTDMYRYHHIALDNLGTDPEERLAKTNGQANPPETLPELAAPTKHAPAQGPRNPMERVALPAASHADGVARANEPQLSLRV